MVKQFYQQLNVCEIQQTKMYCDNQIVIHVTSNLVFKDMTEYIKIDHVIWVKLMLLIKEICNEFFRSNDDELAYALKKILGRILSLIYLF